MDMHFLLVRQKNKHAFLIHYQNPLHLHKELLLIFFFEEAGLYGATVIL